MNIFVGSALVSLILSMGSVSAIAGETIRGELGSLPGLAESNDKGLLVDFVKAMQKAYPEGSIQFEVVPFKRSIQDAIDGTVDFHAPILEDKTKTADQLGFVYSSFDVWDVTFALYTNRLNKEINLTNLAKFNIETDAAHVGYFNFPIQPTSCIECSLKKVAEGRLDGFIFAALESDTVIKKLNLKNIKSTSYKVYAGKFVLPKGPRGKKVDEVLTMVFERTKKNGDYQKTIGKIVEYYKHWKPTP